MFLDFIAGCIGGCAGIAVSHPLDTLKVHIQSGRGSSWECTRNLLRGGTLAAYRGVGAPLGGVAGINAIVFGVYGNTRRGLAEPDALSTHAIAGSVAGLVQSFACAPVELVKTRQQLARHGDGMPQTAWAGARHVLRTEGMRGLFRGFGATVARDAPAFAIYFSAYEWMTRGDQSTMRAFVAGGAAGTLSWVLLYPIDVVKSRIQSGLASTWREAIAKKKLWAGMGAVTARAFLANGACFVAVLWTERLWNASARALPVLSEAVRYDTADYLEM